LVNDGGVVKSGVYDWTHNELISATNTVVTRMTGNALYPNPTPSLEFVASTTQDMQALLGEIEQAKTILRTLMARLVPMRKLEENNYRGLASYVQSASNGNANAIISAGFEVRAAPSPVGDLAPPLNLVLTLNGTIGIMTLSWAPVEKARSYNIQVSEASTMERNWKPFRTSSSTKQKIDGLEPGKVYAFRIAAVGGASGQSPWSAEVIRMAA
jgi:Fibronectin type III domain